MKKNGLKILFVFFLCIFVFSAYSFVSSLMEYRQGDEIYESLAKDIIEIPKQTSETVPIETDVPLEEVKVSTWQVPEINFNKLKDINGDIIGWLIVENTNISYPLLQAQDNQFYTENTADLKKNKAGSIFLDFRNLADLTDNHGIIYGHNLKSGKMFGNLKLFMKQDYVKDHQKFYIITSEKTLCYQVFSAYQTTADSNTYLLDFTKGTSFKQYIDMLQRSSVLNQNIEVSIDDKIVTLSTCTNGRQNDRYVVHGKLVEEISHESK